MQTIFCTNCGSKLTYSGPKPKFCSSCGEPIGGSQKQEMRPEKESKAPSIRDQIVARKNSTPLQEDETDINFVPKVSSFEYEVTNAGEGNPTYKFQDIFNVEQQPEEAKPQKKPRKRSQKRSK